MRITETVYQTDSPTINVATGVLHGVKLLGNESRNGRRYTAEAMQKAVGLYNGRKIYLDHPKRDAVGQDRSFRDWIGESRNAEVRPDGIYGDVHLRTKTDYFEGIIEAAERFPKSVGFSHVADGESRMDGDTEIIESITEVFSVDLVTDPATTAGFFESKQKPTAAESLEAIRVRLTEMLDGEYFDAAGAGDKADPTSQALAAFGQMVAELTQVVKDLAAKIAEAQAVPEPPEPMEAPEMAAEPTSKSATTPPAEPAANDNPLANMQRENAELKAKNLLLESGRDATPARIKALVAAATDDDRKELLETWSAVEAVERPARSPALTESYALPASDFDTPEKFAARYR